MNKLIAEQSENFQTELAALARLVTFARQAAQDLNVTFPVYCLDMALGAVLDELKIAGVDVSTIAGAGQMGHIKDYH